jgi:hypothetical protein
MPSVNILYASKALRFSPSAPGRAGRGLGVSGCFGYSI